MKLRSHLITLVVVTLVPVLAFSAIVLVLAARTERGAMQVGLRAATRGLAVAVDRVLESAIRTLELLSSIEDAVDAVAFRRAAERAAVQRGWLAIGLADASGRVLAHTSAAGPASVADASWFRVAAGGRSTVSDPERYAGRDRCVVVAVPTGRDGRLRRVLYAVLPSDVLARVLEAHDLPGDWAAAIVDGHDTIVARVPGGDRFAGQPASESYRQLVRTGDDGIARGHTVEGAPAYTAFSRLRYGSWTVAFAIPAASMEAAQTRWLWTVGGGGLVFLLAAVLLAAVRGRRLAAPILALSAAAGRVGRGEQPLGPIPAGVNEVNTLAQTLADATARAQAAGERASLLAEASTLLASSLDYDVTLDRLARLIVPRLADLCVVDVVEEDGAFRRVAAAHADPRWRPLVDDLQRRFPLDPRGPHPVARALATGQTQLAGEMSAEALAAIITDPEHLAIARTLGYSSYLVVPLIARGRMLGALSLLSAGSGRRYRASDVPLAEDLARRAAVAIDNARLFRDSETRLHAARTLVEVGGFLNQTLDPAVVAQRITDSVRTLLGLGTSVFYRVSADTEDLTVVAVSGLAGPALTPGTTIPAGAAAAGLAVKERRPVTTPDFLQDPRLLIPPALRPELQRAPYRSVLAVPLLAHERVLGVLALGDAARRTFRAEEIILAQSFAEQAALAIENARLYAEAQEANRAKDEFLATLSHELRTPLTAMLGWVRMLQTGSLDAATTARALEVIDRNTRLQAQLIDDLLDVSRIITGKLRLELRAVDVGAVVEAAVEAVRPTALAKSVDLVQHLDPTVGPVWGDAHRLQQVVWNLLSNAIKFTPASGKVTVSTERGHRHVSIRVQDTGIGIAADFLPYIFDRFRQADGTSTRVHGGLGLGLAIVQHLTSVHRGTVQASSAGPGLGAVFTVRLPLAPVPAPNEPVARVAAGSDRPLGGVRVLVVDDDLDTRDLLATVLGQAGAEVTLAASADDAVTAAVATRPHVVVSDISMPDEDGYRLMQRLRAQGDGVRAVALTAHARAEDRQRALDAGFEVHLAKPVEPSAVVETVARLAPRLPRLEPP